MPDDDRIVQSIDIAAPASRVWDLVSEPGWFVNDGALVPHALDRDGDLIRLHDEVHGLFVLRVVALEPPRYAAFRWYLSADDPDGPSTLVEFRIDDVTPTSVTLTVVESGFASLPGDAAERRRRLDENTTGWELELALARDALEGPGA